MSAFRFLMLLSLVVWIGALIFFPVVAQASFSILPSRHMAGLVVGRSLRTLHWMGIVSGAVFLASSLLYQRTRGATHILSLRHSLIVIMLALTLVSQFSIIPRMDAIRSSFGEVDSIPADNPSRVQFDSLHSWSTRIEGGVLLMGLVVVYLTSVA